MEEQEKPTERLVHTAGEMIETYKDLINLTVVENVTLGISVGVVGMMSLSIVSFITLFLALGCAWWIGEAMNNMKAGFFITGAAFLLILGVVLLAARKGLIPLIRNLVIKKIYEKD
ncbi:MAG TPA: hypothetical protein VFE50_20850 [Cyclobacteriaceae bacterium]|nr:hypothetical protein [Cyclobacteriaceae bacterium]